MLSDAIDDLSEIPPIQQKRTLEFVNLFLKSTALFLNDFASDSETKFIETESKLQSLEASLIILEEKLKSTGLCKPAQTEKTDTEEIKEPTSVITAETSKEKVEDVQDNKIKPEERMVEKQEETTPPPNPMYEKFLKMVQVGVPLEAVKLKMTSEGLDPNSSDFKNATLSRIK